MKVQKGDTWVYHPDHEPQLVYSDFAAELHENGWYDTPAKFPKDESVTDEVSFDDMNRTQVREYGREQGIELAWKSKSAMLEDLIKHLEG